MKPPAIFGKVNCHVLGFDDHVPLLKVIGESFRRIKGRRRSLKFPSLIAISTILNSLIIASWTNNIGGVNGVLEINPSHGFWDNPDEDDEILLIKGVDGILSHELGHVYHFFENFKTYCDPILFTDKERRLVREEVSPYAGTNSREFIAEVFAGKLNDKYFSRRIGSLYKKMIYGKSK